MSTSFGPREVNPRRILHWARAALDLIGRRFGTWLLLMTTACVACASLHRSVVLQEMSMGTFFLFGMSLASAVDRGSLPNFDDLLSHLKQDAAVAVRFSAYVAVGNALGTMLYTAVTGQAHVAALLLFDSHLSDLRITKEGLVWGAFTEIGMLSGASLYSFFFCLALPMWVSMFQYPLMAWTGMDSTAARKLGRAGMPRMNLATMSIFGGAGLGVIALALVCVPVLMPILLAFLSAMTYVAFREIFLGQAENTKVSSVRQQATASASA
jgi:hypothetical protein